MNKEEFLRKLSRRNFIRNSVVAAAGAAIAPSLLTSCNDDDDTFEPLGTFGFLYGVASFDPDRDRVILWSRYTPATNETGNPEIILDVATSADFEASSIVASETVQIDTESDYTINVDVSGLQSNTAYYYRFRNEKTASVSVIGQTKTLPASGELSEVKMAVVSCANYQAGLFNVYGEIAKSDADVVVHLGDYIYEYEAGGYGTNDYTDVLERAHEPAGEIITLDDYRTRYKQYRSDLQLQEVHRLKPFICVWDDHEIANDTYRDGAENHQEDEGSFEERKAAALQVWHEYLPARVDDNAKIYRSFDFAGIVDLIMLDTRVVGRDKQLDYANYYTATGFDSVAFATDLQSTSRTILGQEQQAWATATIAGSTTNWQVLGSQVLMGKYWIPAELLTLISQISATGATPELLLKYQTLVTELITIKTRIAMGDPSVTAEEEARITTVMPYNLDAWDGYPVEREILFAAAAGKKLVSLAGDTHNAWHSQLMDAYGNAVGTELATSSVSSPGFENYLGLTSETVGAFEQSIVALIDDLQFLDASQRGFVMVTFTAAQASAEWFFTESIVSENTAFVSGHTAEI